MNRLTALVALGVLVIGGAILFLLARPEPARGPGVPMAGGPAADSRDEESAPVDPDAVHIPPQFQGSWAPDRLSCAAQGETARVDITADGMDFYESSGRLLQVTPLSGGREHAISLQVTGEGQSWTRTIHLRRVGHELAFRDVEESEDRLLIRC